MPCRAGEVVADMLATEPFFAVHGPPGTGKTTLVAHALDKYLAEEPGARVLVSAQANDSLDHLALRILERIRRPGARGVMPLRIGRDAGRIHPDMRRWQLDELTETVVGRVRAETSRRLEAGAHPRVVPVLEHWLQVLDGASLEIRDRLQRGANLVFATCSGANLRNLSAGGDFAAFDWVIVEEAAKAWPTEVAIPLVRGVSWTLIGDHRQLPAYRSRQVDEVLEVCDSDAVTIERLRAAGARRVEFKAAFEMFKHLFDTDEALPGARRRPVAHLQAQFRMRKPIADVVSEAFYVAAGDPPLLTDPSADAKPGVDQPRALDGLALVWIDTTDADDCFQAGRWRNQGEAALIASLCAQLGLLDGDPDEGRAAILTPWHDQRRCIEERIGETYRRLVHTVDSFQGREAEIVICSLVRDKRERSERPSASLGHIEDPQRANVMLSRAQRLNVIVGSFPHFRESGLDFWKIVCDYVERTNVIVPAERVRR